LFILGKHPTGIQGGLYIAPTNTHYGITDLSVDKPVLIKFPNWDIDFRENCGDINSEDEEGDDLVEERSGCESNNIRVLVLFTPATATSGFNPSTVASGLIAELNASTGASGLSTTDISFTLANTLLLSGFVENGSDAEGDVDALADNTAAQTMRNDNYADIVILLTANIYTGLNGIAKAISALNKNAYCLAEIGRVATGSMTFTGSHEIAHVIGARHQRCTTCNRGQCDVSPWDNHGFSVGTTMGTIMITLPCGKTRIPQFSSETAKFMGLETGNEFNDNAKKLRKRADNVSCFRPQPVASTELNSVDISGNPTICAGSGFGIFNANFNTFAGVPPYVYLWETSPDGISNWTTYSTTAFSPLPLSNAGSLPNPFYLRVTVTDFGGKKGSDMMKVTLDNTCLDGGTDDREGTEFSEKFSEKISPNPVHNILYVQIEKGTNKILIFDLNGLEVMSILHDGSENLLAIDISSLKVGAYFVRSIGINNTKTHKIIKS